MKMLLNEYRLQPWKKEHQDFIVQQMEQYFFGTGGQAPEGYKPPEGYDQAWHAQPGQRRRTGQVRGPHRPRFPLRWLVRSAKINLPLRRTRAVNRRDVAQPGRALAWGARGRQFKSAHPDHSFFFALSKIMSNGLL